MGDKTGISWTDSTWNPVRGCSRVSLGCGGPNHQGGCYAEKVAARFSDPGQPYHGFAERSPDGGRWTGKVALVPSALDLPLRWRRPRRIFVNSMSDLFHEGLTDDAINQVFAVMALAPHHTFQVLTKRADRMRAYVARLARSIEPLERAARTMGFTLNYQGLPLLPWPIPSVWLGVSVEDQDAADKRIPDLLATPAAVRFLSCEPLLGPIHLDWLPYSGPDWVIAGGESGPRRRPINPDWMRSLRDQCAAAGVAFYAKQIDKVQPLPADLQQKEFPDQPRSAEA